MASNRDNQQEHQRDWRPGDRPQDDGYNDGGRRPANPRGTIKDQMFQALNDPKLSPDAKVQALATINNTLTIKYLIERQNQVYEDVGKELSRMNEQFEGIVRRMDNCPDQTED